MMEPTRFDLSQESMPTAWFNIMPSLVQAGIQPLPPLHPGTKEPVTPDLLAPLFPEALIMQEVATEEWIDIPGGILDVYRLWRPSPLHRAVRLEQALQTPARIYYKYEGVSPAGSHKPNTAVAQAFYNKEAGTKRIATETGAGQWGSALSMACSFFGIGCQVFMVRASYEQKPYRRIFMETFGAEVIPSPSPTTQAGKGILEAHPDSTGSLGIAISEAVEVAATSNGAVKYSLGSVLNHVLLHQTVIGLEAKEQMKLAGEATRRRDRVRGRRLQLRRARLSVHGGPAGRAHPDQVHRDRAGRLSDPHEGAVRVRPRRRGRDDAAAADVHARAHVRSGARARRRSSLPRRLAVAFAVGEARPHGGACLHPERGVRRRRSGSRTPRGSSPRRSPRTG